MPKFLFPVIITTIFILLDFYVYNGYKSLFNSYLEKNILLPKHLYWGINIGIILLFLYLIFTFPDKNHSTLRTLLSAFIFILFLSKLLFASFLLIDDFFRIFRFAGAKLNPTNGEGIKIGRLQFIVKAGAALGITFSTGLVYGVLKGSHRYRVIKKKLYLKNLPKSFEGFKIVQISDIHSGSFWDKEAVKKGVKMVNDLHGDVVFFTGDIINNDISEMDEYLEVFKTIKAPNGVFATMGNHDYGEYKMGYTKDDLPRNIERIEKLHQELEWDLLMNENRTIEKNGDKISIIGIENWGSKGRFPKYGKMDKAMKGVDKNSVNLLLSHDPSHWQAQVIPNYPTIDCMFAGHTHGMQFGIETAGFKWSPVKYLYKEWAGLYEHKNGQQLYVNRGFGYLGFPGRLGIWPEITMFELKSS